MASYKGQTLQDVNPKIAAQWHPTKNGTLKPTDVTPGTNKKVWWQCEKGHEWQQTVSARNHSAGKCPYCSGNKVQAGYNDLASVYPALATEWHPTKNGSLRPTDITKSSNRKVWWLGKCGHEWEASPNSREKETGGGCPYCNGKKVLVGFNDLVTTDPDVAAQWHPTRNDDLTPENVTRSSNKYAWWQCSKGHEWRARIKNRTRIDHPTGCPYCAGKKKLD